MEKLADTNKEKTATTAEPTKNKAFYFDAKVKELLANADVQAALKNHIKVPGIVLAKKVSKASTDHHTQKIEYMAGKTIEDAITGKLTIMDETDTNFLNPVNVVNKKYKITDYTLALDANMEGRNFTGYSAIGLKLIVHKLEEV